MNQANSQFCNDPRLFDFFVDRVGVAMRAELFQLQAAGRIATVLGGSVAGNSWRSLIEIAATLGTLKRNDNSDALLASHNVIQFTDQ